MSAYICEQCKGLKDGNDIPCRTVQFQGQEEQLYCEDCADELADQAQEGEGLPFLLDGIPFTPGRV